MCNYLSVDAIQNPLRAPNITALFTHSKKEKQIRHACDNSTVRARMH
jgi:hypothetical protein